MSKTLEGWINGFIGMLIFSGSLAATRVAVFGFDPVFLTVARAAIAGLIAAVLLRLLRQPRPSPDNWRSVLIVALGVVVGFPLLTALALQYITAARSIVFIGLLPLCTAIFAVLRAGERPQPVFWVFALAGSALVAGFAIQGADGGMWGGDLLMLGAIVICGLGYAEGAKLSRQLGGWQVICWALVFALPVMIVLCIATAPESLAGIDGAAWLGLGYVSLFSMLIGFFFWYRGLALGGIATVGQLQLLQPFFGLLIAAIVLAEHVDLAMVLVAMGVVFCVGAAKRFSS